MTHISTATICTGPISAPADVCWCVCYELVVYVCAHVCESIGSDLLPFVHFTHESRSRSHLAAVVSEWILAFHETMLCFVFIQINNNNNNNNNSLRSSAKILDSFVKFPEKSIWGSDLGMYQPGLLYL